MPGYAGSSWYFLRYMDPNNNQTFCDRKASDYWNQVDLYIGGTEHAVGHLLYSRMWTKVLFDLGLIGYDEPFKKLLNQGMIQGSSRLVYMVSHLSFNGGNLEATMSIYNRNPLFISIELNNKLFKENRNSPLSKDIAKKILAHANLVDAEDKFLGYSCYKIHANVDFVDGVILDTEKFKTQKADYKNAAFLYEENGQFICEVEVEKMSKSKLNTVNPNELCEKYGADTFRMYEMFLGPVEASKPWDTKGIEGVHRFLRKLWRLFNDDIKGPIWTSATPSPQGRVGEVPSHAELKVLHRTIKKIEEDTERFSFNTAVSTFMICVNELADLKCHKKEVLEPLLILLTPYAPHIAEELFQQLNAAKVPSPGGDLGEARASILDAAYPTFNPALLVENTKEYPVSINGKLRTNMELALDLEQPQVEALVLQNEIVQKWLEGKVPKKIIFVKNKMINVVI
jgi:leucyl-tRNA synthetase